jgi:hypothetical protein
MTYKPMLAYKFNNKKVNWAEPVYIQPKLQKTVHILVPVNNLKT